MCTMQAPHSPVPQPNLVPVSLRSSRSTHNSGVAGGASVDAGLPFTTKLVAIASSLLVLACVDAEPDAHCRASPSGRNYSAFARIGNYCLNTAATDARPVRQGEHDG